MTSLVYLVLTLLAAASAAPEPRIVGGAETSIQEFPYIVALVYTYPGPGITVQRCVGCLISSWHVLSTGYCFTGAILDNMKVRAGSTTSLAGGSVAGVAGVEKHPGYVETPRRDDVAVLTLNTPFGISDVINVLYLPPQGQFIVDGQEVKVVSWGFDENDVQLERLKTIHLNKVNTDVCATLFNADSDIVIRDEMICASAGSRSVCNGDSGAPMVIGTVVVGTASNYLDCSGDHPSIFTRIDRYTNWIMEVATAPGRDSVGIRSVPLRATV